MQEGPSSARQLPSFAVCDTHGAKGCLTVVIVSLTVSDMERFSMCLWAFWASSLVSILFTASPRLWTGTFSFSLRLVSEPFLLWFCLACGVPGLLRSVRLSVQALISFARSIQCDVVHPVHFWFCLLAIGLASFKTPVKCVGKDSAHTSSECVV